MTQRDDTTRLRHMLDYAREVIEMAADKRREDLEADRQFELAMTRLIEIIGEAAAHISSQGRLQFPSIPWEEVVGLRNRLIHGYDAVDHDILWDIIRYDLPELIIALQSAPSD